YTVVTISTSSGHDAAGWTLTSITPGSGPIATSRRRGSLGRGYPSITIGVPSSAAAASTAASSSTACSSRSRGGRNTWTRPSLTSTQSVVGGASSTGATRAA